MGSFTATLFAALLSAGVSPERAREVVDQFDRAIDERFGLHAQQLATKRDLAELQAAIVERIVRSDERIAELDARLTSRIAESNERIAGTNERIAELDLRLSSRIAELDLRLSSRIAGTNERIAETKADLVRWMLGALTAQTALILGAFKLL